MKFNIKLISFFCIFSFVFIMDGFAQTRNNAISEAKKYITNCQWIVNQNNIIDIGGLVGSTANDGYDDRMGKVDEDGNGTISPQELEKALTRWPFEKGETYTGEAYAWAGYSGAIKWGADTVSVFENRILDTDNKWIAGRSSGDSLANGYKGFAGIDCSGLVGNALNINRFAADEYKLNVSQIKARCIPVKLEEMKKGDVFASNGHILLFTGDWVTEYSKGTVIHSVGGKYSERKHIRKAIEETIKIKKISNSIAFLRNESLEPVSDWITHSTLSPFPQFSDFEPEEGSIIGNSKPEIKVKIKSGTNIKVSSIVMKIDGTVVSPDISPSSDAKEINISYTPTDDLSLEEHNVYVYKTLLLT